MSGTGHVAIPQPLVDNDEELLYLMYVYGRDAVRAGFRRNNAETMSGRVTSESFCATTEGEQFVQRCGPFRVDHFTAPLWFPIKSESILDLPPR